MSAHLQSDNEGLFGAAPHQMITSLLNTHTRKGKWRTNSLKCFILFHYNNVQYEPVPEAKRSFDN